MTKENREHKSSVFADLFYYDESAKENLLELHNALYGTQYSDPGVVDLIGLEDVLFRDFKNDVAFSVAGQSIVLSEHQSTVNANMPIRDLLYIAREYEKVIPARSRYKTGLIKIPTPRFLVFYNGVRNQPLEQTLRLSDAFMEKEEEPGLELVVRVININSDKHHELLEKCRVLKEYSLFVETVRKYQKEKAPLTKAIKECIEKDILADYLLKKSNEVINMLMAEYDYETDIEVQREEAAETAYDSGLAEGEKIGRKSGLAEGEKIGRKSGLAEGVAKGRKMFKQALLLRRAGKTHEEIAEECNLPVAEVDDMLEGLE